MKAIAAVDLNWGIGYQGKLLQWIPEDMKFFRQMTLGKVVVMGRETFESFPGQEPLKDRVNIVLTRNIGFTHNKMTICGSLDELLDILKGYKPEDIFIIGGELVYTQLLPYCTEAYVTKIDKAYLADKYFPILDNDRNWELDSESETKYYQDISFRFCKYISAR